MQQLLLIRHGTTDWNLSGRLNSFTDLPLNFTGIEEVNKLGQYLHQIITEASIWCSPAIRAKETGNAISQALACNYKIIPEAREIDFGKFEGKNPQDLIDSPMSNHYQAWQDGHSIEGTESLVDGAIRAKHVFNYLSTHSKSDVHILVSHGVFIRVLICSIVFDMTPSAYRKIVIDNASVTILRIYDNQIRLAQLNNRCFI